MNDEKKLTYEEMETRLALIEKKSVVALGESEAFALRDEDGDIRAFKRSLHLAATTGGLIQPVYNGPFVVSAQGYEMWAEAAGAQAIFPKSIQYKGATAENPFVIEDDNNRIKRVVARCVAFRFSAMGIPVVCDWTTTFDIPSYRMIDLLAKAKKFKDAFCLYPKGASPEDGDKTARWSRYDFDESVDLWINVAHPEAIQWYSSIINKEKKAMDFAQTFARRNALKHLSGLQKAPAADWVVPVFAWRPTGNNLIKWDQTQYSMLQDKVGGEMNPLVFSEQNPKQRLITGTSDADDTENAELAESTDNIDSEDQADVINVEHTTVEETSTPAEEAETKPEKPAAKKKKAAPATKKKEKPVPEKKAELGPPPVLTKEGDIRTVKSAMVMQAFFEESYKDACEKFGHDPDGGIPFTEKGLALANKIRTYVKGREKI